MTDKLNSGNSVTFTTIEIDGVKWVPLKEAYKLQDRILDLERRIRAKESYDPTVVLKEEIEFLENKVAGLTELLNDEPVNEITINAQELGAEDIARIKQVLDEGKVITIDPNAKRKIKYLVVPYSQIEMYDDPMTAVLASNREQDAGPYGTVFEVVANWGRTREPGNDYNIERKDLEGFNSKQYNPQTRRLEFGKYVD